MSKMEINRMALFIRIISVFIGISFLLTGYFLVGYTFLILIILWTIMDVLIWGK